MNKASHKNQSNIEKNNKLIKEVSNYLDYNNLTGDLYWTKNIGGNSRVGTIAGHLSKLGYWIITYKRQPLKSHRIVFWKLHGFLPDVIDHVDGNKANNRPNNLRESNTTENGHNRIEHRRGSKLGTSYRKDNKKWVAQCWVQGKKVYLGQFNTREDAEYAYRKFKGES